MSNKFENRPPNSADLHRLRLGDIALGVTALDHLSAIFFKSIEIKINLTESAIAKSLTEMQKRYSEVSMGSYPFEGGTSLVFRSIDYNKLEEANAEMVKILKSINYDGDPSCQEQ